VSAVEVPPPAVAKVEVEYKLASEHFDTLAHQIAKWVEDHHIADSLPLLQQYQFARAAVRARKADYAALLHQEVSR
jgi:hypothetical protein